MRVNNIFFKKKYHIKEAVLHMSSYVDVNFQYLKGIKFQASGFDRLQSFFPFSINCDDSVVLEVGHSHGRIFIVLSKVSRRL